MKKLYTTLTLAAMSVATALAAVPVSSQLKGEQLDWAGSTMTIKEVPVMNNATRIAKKHKAAARVEGEQSLEGEQVMIYMPLFSGYLQQELTQVINVTEDEDGLNLDGFCGWSVDTDFVDGITPFTNIYGEYCDEGIKVEAGQYLGTWLYNGVMYDLVLLMYVEGETEEDGGWNASGEGIFYYDEGVYANDTAWGVGMLYEENGAYNLFSFTGGCDMPSIAPANGHMSFTREINGNIYDIENPVYYSIVDNGDGTESLMISYFGAVSEDGYLVELPINEDGVAAANEVPAFSYNQQVYFYGQLSSTYITLSFSIDCNDPANLLVPAQDYWDANKGEEGTEPDYYNVWTECRPTEDNRVTYYGEYTPTTIVGPEADGVDKVGVDAAANGATVYYNLQGIQVANPANGIYIMKQGNKTSKVLVK